MGPTSIYVRSSKQSESSKLESDIVALYLGHNGEQCCCVIGHELNFPVITHTYMWLAVIELTGPGLNSRPSFYLLKDATYRRPLNRTSFYLEEASIQGNAEPS